MTDADYTDDLALLRNTSAQVESQLNSIEQTSGSIGFYVNSNKRESMCFEQKRSISTLSGKHSKLVDQLTYFGSNISSPESYINIRKGKAWALTNKL